MTKTDIVLRHTVHPEVLPPALPGDAEARRFEQSKVAANTKKAYQSTARTYQKWCTEHGCHWVGEGMSDDDFADQVRRYLAMRKDAGRKIKTLALDLTVINQARIAIGKSEVRRHPKVVGLNIGIKRHAGQTGERTRKMGALSPGMIQTMCSAQRDDLWGVRNRALLLVGFMCAMRRQELCNLKVADVILPNAEGMQVTITHSKTDQSWEGRRIFISRLARAGYCPVQSLVDWWEWLREAGCFKPDNYLFCAVRRDEKPSGCALTGNDVRLIIINGMRRAGLDSSGFSGHSLRSGFITSSLKAGMTNREVMDVSGHKTEAMLDGYYRKDEVPMSVADRLFGG